MSLSIYRKFRDYVVKVQIRQAQYTKNNKQDLEQVPNWADNTPYTKKKINTTGYNKSNNKIQRRKSKY